MRSVCLVRGREEPGPRTALLVVEDDPATAFAMREFFARAGFEVDCAAAAEEAIALLDWRVYDAVITDLHLTAHRRGEGMKVAWHARRRQAASCIVMLTGHGTETTQEEAHRCGVDVYQIKPVELPHLRSSIDGVLNRNRDAGGARGREPKWRQH